MDVNETVRDIKAQFRLFMNGVVSQSMREKGLEYKLNFGIELPRLKEIAQKYEKNHQLAQALWKENTRECKILAGLLQPVESFYPEIAEIWIEDMSNIEIAEITCMTLFQNLPYITEKSFEWIASDRKYFQICGFMTMARLLSKGMKLNERADMEFIDQAFASIGSDDPQIRKATATALKKYGQQNRENSKKVMKLLMPLLKSDNKEMSLVASEIKFDIES